MKKHSILRGQLQSIRNNYALVQVGIALMIEEGAVERVKATVDLLSFHPEIETFSYITYVFDDPKVFKHATQELRNSVLRNCLKEMFELAKAYAEETEQGPALRKADWYEFLRMVRNCLSHDMQLHFNPRDLKRLPCSWSGITIDKTMNGMPLQAAGLLTRPQAIALMDGVIRFVKDGLK